MKKLIILAILFFSSFAFAEGKMYVGYRTDSFPSWYTGIMERYMFLKGDWRPFIVADIRTRQRLKGNGREFQPIDAVYSIGVGVDYGGWFRVEIGHRCHHLFGDDNKEINSDEYVIGWDGTVYETPDEYPNADRINYVEAALMW